MNKAERIDRVQNTLTEEELRRRLPEVSLLMDQDVEKATVRSFLKGCPDYFWELASSSTGKYHAVDERGLHGNWIHTKRVFVAYLALSRTYLEQGLITELEREAGKSAALIHDMLKYGWPSQNREHTASDHDIIGSDVSRYIGGASEATWSPIHAHNGAWADGKNPETDFEQILHLADYTASKPVLGNPKIWNPADEILDEFPDIETLSDDTLNDLL
jgi:hypothetical protein